MDVINAFQFDLMAIYAQLRGKKSGVPTLAYILSRNRTQVFDAKTIGAQKRYSCHPEPKLFNISAKIYVRIF